MNLQQQIDDLIKNYRDGITLEKYSPSDLFVDKKKSDLRKETLDANNGHNLAGRINGENIILCPKNTKNPVS